ncbi:PQ loop repeat protein [Phialemonium atrogriseum]|uniref:PQ loop repeat protein n=1 Tax=Phialemonium atrogriseum TaxID=1093897 RepID=A0AAJ0C1R8_9PEZI|nr:PQ loop repeat protein [Phialemonium atrogriseum]KAK1767523.1 PQ loop repeat protein [Phialemonium atrogriseum]
MDFPAAANALGTLGAVCWSVQLIPQIVVNYRRHYTTGLQPSMMMLWAWAGVPLGVYNIVEEFNVALRIQPQILTFLSLVTWIQCYYCQRKWTVVRSLLVVVPIAVAMASISGGTDPVLLAAGVLRHYWDISMHRTVRGISFIFVGIDAAGDLFSLLSVFFQPRLDILGMVIYGPELVLWLGVFACGGYYNLLPWIREKWFADQDQARHSRSPDLDIVSSTHAGSASGHIVLHDMPSSTSVFSTASRGSAGLRPRAVASLRRSSDEQRETSVHTTP